MNPYELLEVPFNASHAEIKAAYRRAVKKHHPDVSGNNGSETIILINQAYELLTDPERRKKYDSAPAWTYEVPLTPDPREIYKKEFLARKQAQALARIVFERKVFEKMVYVNMFIAVFAFAIIFDQLLPTVDTSEFAIYPEAGNSRGDQIETGNYRINIPRSAELKHNFVVTEPIRLTRSLIFRVPTRAVVTSGDKEWTFVPAATVFSFAIPFHYVIFFFCVLTLSQQSFGAVSFSICFAPSILLFFMVTIVM
jgi:hypothetical protein